MVKVISVRDGKGDRWVALVGSNIRASVARRMKTESLRILNIVTQLCGIATQFIIEMLSRLTVTIPGANAPWGHHLTQRVNHKKSTTQVLISCRKDIRSLYS